MSFPGRSQRLGGRLWVQKLEYRAGVCGELRNLHSYKKVNHLFLPWCVSRWTCWNNTAVDKKEGRLQMCYQAVWKVTFEESETLLCFFAFSERKSERRQTGEVREMINGFRGAGRARSRTMYPGINFSGSWVWPQFHLSLRYTSVSSANKLPWEGSHSNWLSPGRCVLCHPEGNFRGPLPAHICCSFEIGRGQFSEIIFLSLSRVGQANWAPVTFSFSPFRYKLSKSP